MRKLKSIVAVIVLLISSNLMYAASSTTLRSDSINSHVNNATNDSVSNTGSKLLENQNLKAIEAVSIPMVEQLDRDVKLTTDQKRGIKDAADKYAANLIKARAMSNKADSYEFMIDVTNEYKLAQENILTTEQKIKKEKIEKEKIEKILAKQKNKENKK